MTHTLTYMHIQIGVIECREAPADLCDPEWRKKRELKIDGWMSAFSGQAKHILQDSNHCWLL